MSWITKLGRGAFLFAGFAFACSASAPNDGADEGQVAGSKDSGSSINLPQSEVCGNNVDDDKDGLVDEGCNCPTVPNSNGEIPNVPGCGGGDVDSGTTTSCVPDGPTETQCEDGRDDDCDGNADCADPDCTAACTCEPVETKCGDGVDDDCDGKVDCSDDECPKCVPGSMRYCDEPVFCAWGIQTCGPDGRWGNCTETQPPPGCESFLPFGSTYDGDCCVAQGYCCQAYPADNSVGDCAGIALCS